MYWDFATAESSEHILHIKTATEMMLRKLVKVTDAYPLTEADIALITTASSLHDIGKVGIPEEILNKPGRLTDEEFKIMKTHSEIGASLIRDMHFYKINHWYIPHGKFADGIMKDGMEKVTRMD